MSKRSHLIIPDTQIMPGVPTDFLDWIGKYIVHKKPDVIIQMGDFADMHSLSSYDRGTKKGEGSRYHEDISAANKAMDRLMKPIEKHNKMQKRNKRRQYKPKKVLTLGNHENRINRYANSNPMLHGHVSTDDLNYKDHGWDVHDFLEVVEVDGIAYSHFFPRSASGRVMQSRSGAPTASTQVKREMRSCTSGHLQGLDMHIQQTEKHRLYGLICGSCYQHEEEYLTPQGTAYWRGIVLKNEVRDGEYDPCFISLNYLKEKYG